MATQCPKCKAENPDTQSFCGDCGTRLSPSKDIPSITKTLETPIQHLTIGTLFADKYEILGTLGKGGMGEVYKVKDQKLDEEIALKVLKPEIAAFEGTLDRFKNELKIARKITHKNICRMFDLNVEGDTPYITMEYVSGKDLKSFIKGNGTIKEKEAVGIAKQVCEGLVEAHELGVVHRDLKPQNIMINEEGSVKVMDFGIARSVEAQGVTQTGVIIGTPEYISPEQAAGEEADQRADIYSLGVILYEMVTGSVPFKGETAFSVALKHKSQLPQNPRKRNPDISESMSRLILICMEKDRARRYQTAEALLADLKNIEDGFPLGTKIRPRRETLIATLDRKRLFVPSLIVAVALIAVAIWQLLPEKQAGPLDASGKPSLAVVYFENNTGDESLDHWRKALPALLTTDLSESKLIDVLPGDRLFKILTDLNQLETESYSSDVLKEVAAKGDVTNIVRGSYTKAGDAFRINVVLQNAITGKQLGSNTVEGQGEESFFSLVDELTPIIKSFFSLSAEEIASDIDRDIGTITTSFPEAYRYFSEGVEYHFIGDYRRAVQFFERAVAVDPEFASAYRWMAWAYNQMVDKSAFKENIEKAYALSEKLPEGERLQIEGDFYLKSEETYDKAIATYRKYLEIYSDDWLINDLLGYLYKELEEWDKSIEQFKLSIENNPDNYSPYGNLAMSYQAKGMHTEAKEILEYYLENYSDHPMMRYWLAQNYIFLGEYELALAQADKALSIDPDIYYSAFTKGYAYECKGDFAKAEIEFNKIKQKKDIISQIWAKGEFSCLYLLQGRIEDSLEQIKQGITLCETVGKKEEESYFRVSLARVYLKSGNPKEALIEIEKAFESAVQAEHLYLQRVSLYFKGIAYLEMKSLDLAQKAAEELKEFLENGLNQKAFRFYYSLMGQLELEKNNFSQAIEYIEQASSLSPFPSIKDIVFVHKHITLILDPLAYAYFRAGDLEKALKMYEMISTLTSASICYEGDTYVKSFYMLGRIYEQQGNTAKAIEHYEKFLDLWKDADPGIAELDDARARLAELGFK